MASVSKWELETAVSFEEAKKLALAGWELVQVNQHPSGDSEDWICFYFRREKK